MTKITIGKIFKIKKGINSKSNIQVNLTFQVIKITVDVDVESRPAPD